MLRLDPLFADIKSIFLAPTSHFLGVFLQLQVKEGYIHIIYYFFGDFFFVFFTE